MGFIFRSRRGSLKIRLVLALVLLGVMGYQKGYFSRYLGGGDAASPAAEAEMPRTAGIDTDGSAEVERLFTGRQSGQEVEVRGRVQRTLDDDEEGAHHQRFLLELSSGRTLLVAHNLELADRVPLKAGDAIQAHGEYEWNEQGGVLHWTHHDPDGLRPGGWILHQGTRYR